MKTVQLTNSDKVGLISDEDYDKVMRYKWYLHTGGSIRSIEKISKKEQNVTLSMFLLNAFNVDHKDRNQLNNQRDNIRKASRSKNNANRIGWSNKSNYKGCYYYPDRPRQWRSKITVNGCFLHLGFFATELEAAAAYNVAATKHFGDFALLNDIEQMA